MASNDVTSLISDIIVTLKATGKAYNTINEDETLPAAFHEAGRGLTIVGETFKTAQSQLQERSQAGDPQSVINTLKACNAKTKLSMNVFEQVSQEPETSRFERYKAVVRHENRGSLVEVLVVGIMNDTYTLVEENATEAAMKPLIKELRDAIDALSKMGPSVPDEQSRNVFANYGHGNQMNAPDGTQYNNIGKGNQFSGTTFSGPVTF